MRVLTQPWMTKEVMMVMNGVTNGEMMKKIKLMMELLGKSEKEPSRLSML